MVYISASDDKNIQSSEVVADREGRQYHIGLAPGEIASTVLLVGDPARAEKVANFFDNIILKRANREFVTFTGRYQGSQLTVMATGIGPSNVEIALIELAHIHDFSAAPLNLIRIGTCGGLQPHVDVGDLVISTGAVRLEDTSLYFVDSNFPAVADYEIINALIFAAEKNQFKYHVGLTASGSGFYGAQGRKIPSFPVKDLTIPDQLQQRNVLNFEMESSTLFTLATLAHIRAGTVCTVYANRPRGVFISSNKKTQAEQTAIQCGLDAAIALEKMDRQKKALNFRYWHSGLNI